MTLAPHPAHPVSCAWAGVALDGFDSGDLELVVLRPHGAVVAVIDGLGHGPEAADAARAASQVLTSSILAAGPNVDVADLVQRCHEGVHHTRGVVLTIASLDAQRATIEWCGVGNVEGVLFHLDPNAAFAKEALTIRGGVVGYRLPQLKVGTSKLWPGDLLVLATDGIRSDFSEAAELHASPEVIANKLLAAYRKDTDDALVLVTRYSGPSP